MNKKNKKNKDLYIFFVSVILVFVASVAMLSLLKITSIYFVGEAAKNEIKIKKEIQIQSQINQKPVDPLIIPAP